MNQSLQDDEFVVYNPYQQRLAYLVEFLLQDDVVKDYTPNVITLPRPVGQKTNIMKTIGGYNYKFDVVYCKTTFYMS